MAEMSTYHLLTKSHTVKDMANKLRCQEHCMVIGNLKKGSKSSLFVCLFNGEYSRLQISTGPLPNNKRLWREHQPLTGYCLANSACLLYSELTKRHCDSRDYQPAQI